MKCYKCEDLMLVIKKLENELQQAAAKIPEESNKLVGSTWETKMDASIASRVDKITKEADEALLRFSKRIQDEAKELKKKKKANN